MLVLSRRSQERIYLDDGRIELTVLRIEGNRVRLGITAPPEVSIRREEVQHRLDFEKPAAPVGNPKQQVKMIRAVA